MGDAEVGASFDLREFDDSHRRMAERFIEGPQAFVYSPGQSYSTSVDSHDIAVVQFSTP